MSIPSGEDYEGTPAFPTARGGSVVPGMSLRDYFAVQAMAGILSGPLSTALWGVAENAGQEPSETLAEAAIDYADALLKALGK